MKQTIIKQPAIVEKTMLKELPRLLTQILLTIVFSCTFIGCKKFVEVNPPSTSITETNVYKNDATAISVLNGIYAKISMNSNYVFGFGGVSTVSLSAGLSSDELTLFDGASLDSYIAYYQNALSVSSAGFEFWTSIYNNIYSCNSAIEGLTKANNLTPTVRDQLLGEAKFLRAFFYFYLTNLYGDLPLVISTDYKSNSLLGRSAQIDVYNQIKNDLSEAQELLSSDYLDATLQKMPTDRVRPNKWTAASLLARVYLFTQDWSSAEAQSTAVINQTSLYSILTNLDQVFLKNSPEAIWQLQPVNSGWNTEDARIFIIPVEGLSNNNPVYLNADLLAEFEMGDQRRNIWIDSILIGTDTYHYPFKYKVNTIGAEASEYLMVFRLAEQYLIRAEARVQQDNMGGAEEDLNAIRSRAGLADTSANDKQSLLNAIWHERQVELFTEWGHRWFDLKRTSRIEEVMSLVTPNKGGTWNSNWQLYPIPLADIEKAPNITQNLGY